MDSLLIRPATAADAETVAAIHCESWRDAYANVLDAAYLVGPVEQDRGDLWRGRLGSPVEEQVVLIADLPGTGPVGFICLYRDSDAQWGSLIDNLHVVPRMRGHAIGRQLMRAGTEVLRVGRAAPCGIHLWVFEANTGGRRFYERLGGRVVERCLETELPVPPDTWILRVYWADPANLQA